MLKVIPIVQKSSWQEILSNALTNPTELYTYLNINPEDLPVSLKAIESFPLRVPRPYLERIKKSDPNDPLLLQILPRPEEEALSPGYETDPLQENAFKSAPGILQKYHGRVLLMPTSSCAIHCRYCFRRHFPYQDNIPDKKMWQNSIEEIRSDTSIEEVILSGGDPLAISDRHLDWFLSELESIPHISRLRFHTRLPIMIPQRITTTLCERLDRSPFNITMVIHSNHAQEFDAQVDNACLLLRQANTVLLNQSVLLQGINDSEPALLNLHKRMFQAGVLPYYLHMPDKVQGTAHFSVEESRAVALMQALSQQSPGYLVPRLVREVPYANAKTPVF